MATASDHLKHSYIKKHPLNGIQAQNIIVQCMDGGTLKDNFNFLDINIKINFLRKVGWIWPLK